MPVEIWRPTHGLARVVDNEVEAVAGVAEVLTERLDAGGVTQIEPEDFQAVAPCGEVGLAGVAQCRVARKASGDDHVRTGAEQLDPGLVADLHPAAGEQRHPTVQVGRLGPFGEIELGALRAHLVVEVVN